ncbi:MAG: ABC transporter ATP-binding protein [Rhodothalassiaceae bacterium]|nr:MAG: ABC transporter ATP-binding protein [Rhodothalassiaceae bacterium]
MSEQAATAVRPEDVRANEPLVRLEEITKVYRTGEVETVALDGVSLTIEEGEFVAVMGPSGCGKSTLLNILGMLDAPTSGHYWFRGRDIAGWPERRLAKLRKGHVGFIFQSFNLIDELTVFENIELALLYLGMSKKERRARVEAVMERFGIAHRARHRPSQLSGGQQQRVAVARALVAEPDLILADEPTGNLDSVQGQEVMEMLKELNEEGSTIVMVTHSPAHAEWAKRIVHLFDGRIVSENLLAAV